MGVGLRVTCGCWGTKGLMHGSLAPTRKARSLCPPPGLKVPELRAGALWACDAHSSILMPRAWFCKVFLEWLLLKRRILALWQNSICCRLSAADAGSLQEHEMEQEYYELQAHGMRSRLASFH